MGDLLKRLNLPPNTTYARRDTLRNGKPLSIESRNCTLPREPCHSRNGLELTRTGPRQQQWLLTSWTVENFEHVVSSSFLMDGTRLVEGSINCFSIGWVDADQGYLDMLLDEHAENRDVPWDEIKLLGH